MESEPWGGSWDDILNIIKIAKIYHIPIIPIKAGDIYRLLNFRTKFPLKNQPNSPKLNR